jgi:hypothetical protein
VLPRFVAEPLFQSVEIGIPTTEGDRSGVLLGNQVLLKESLDFAREL